MKNHLCFAIMAAAIFGSCDKSTGPYSAAIADPQLRWQSYSMSSYSMEQERDCFCIDAGRWVTVTVKNDSIVNVTESSTDSTIEYERWQQYKTVNQLFTLIKSINKDSVAAFNVKYDTTFGFPVSLYVDPKAQIADEEYGYGVKNLIHSR